MIRRFIYESSIQELLSGRLPAAAGRLDRHKNLVDLSQHGRVFECQRPSFLSGIVLIENSKAARGLGTAVLLAPDLKGYTVHVAFILKIVSINDQILSLGVKDAEGDRTHFA